MFPFKTRVEPRLYDIQGTVRFRRVTEGVVQVDTLPLFKQESKMSHKICTWNQGQCLEISLRFAGTIRKRRTTGCVIQLYVV
jgi:hypothetical protein